MRVEFDVGGHQLITNGGTVGLWCPGTFSPEAATLLSDIGVDRERYYRQAAADINPVNVLGLKQGRFFGREAYGRDALVTDWISWDDPKALQAALERSPLKADEKAGFFEYYAGKTDYMPGVPIEEKVRRLRSMTYYDYLAKVAGIPLAVVDTIQAQEGPDNSNQAAGPDTYSAWFAYRRGLDGFAGRHHHFPVGAWLCHRLKRVVRSRVVAPHRCPLGRRAPALWPHCDLKLRRRRHVADQCRAQSHRAVNEIINDIIRPTYDFHFSERDTMGINGTYPDKL